MQQTHENFIKAVFINFQFLSDKFEVFSTFSKFDPA